MFRSDRVAHTLVGVTSASHKRSWWRFGTPAVVLVCGALFIVSAQNSEGTDLRPGRYSDLATLAGTEADRYQRLQERVSDLTAEVQSLTGEVEDTGVARYRQEIQRLKDPAGLTPRSGPGLKITLSDAPDDVIESAQGDPNLLVVHQQDIQAVVNALWRGGADAVTIQGQRVISTTGIKCSGSTVQLQGVPYPQPFVIEAVGDIDDMTEALDGDGYVALYREQAADPGIAIGWSMEPDSRVEAPAYDGLLDLNYAEPITD